MRWASQSPDKPLLEYHPRAQKPRLGWRLIERLLTAASAGVTITISQFRGIEMILMHTNYGDIAITLDTENTPKTAENFLQYVKNGFYDNTIFHRIIKGFMIQGGGFKPGMIQLSTNDTIENEAPNAQKNTVGTLAMARTSDPHSASAQFFINVADNHFLDFKSKTPDGWGYCVFGRVTDGLDIVKKMSLVQTTSRAGHADVPMEDVIIQSIELTDAQ